MQGRGSSSARRSWPSPTSRSQNYGLAGSSSARPPCQICNRPSLSAINCFPRMNHAYEGQIPTQKLTAMATIASSNAHPTTWISDIGASNHITSDLANLVIHNEYHG